MTRREFLALAPLLGQRAAKDDPASTIQVSKSPKGDWGSWRTYHPNGGGSTVMGKFRIEKAGPFTVGDNEIYNYEISGATLTLTSPDETSRTYH